MEAEKGTASSLEFGVWRLEFGAWSFEFDAWSLEFDARKAHACANNTWFGTATTPLYGLSCLSCHFLLLFFIFMKLIRQVIH